MTTTIRIRNVETTKRTINIKAVETRTVRFRGLKGDKGDAGDLQDISGKEDVGVAAALLAGHEGNYAHDEIFHINRVALDLVTGINTGDQDLSGKEDVGAAAAEVAAHEVTFYHDLITHANRAALNLVSGTNTGDQDLSGKEDVGVAQGIVDGHELAYDHADITHANRADLDLVSGTNTGDQDLSALALKTTFEAWRNPSGWINSAGITISYDSVNRRITLTGDLRYMWNGEIKELTSPFVSDAHGTTLDLPYFLFTTDGVTFSWSNSVWTFFDVMAAYVWYGTTNKFAFGELHALMDPSSHQEFHSRIGTYKASGGTLDSYTLNSTTAGNRRPTIAETIVRDEDYQTTLPAVTDDTYTYGYLLGSDFVFVTDYAEIGPVSGGRPQYNLNTGGVWSLANYSNNSYGTLWLIAMPVTSDAGSQKFRFVWVVGQTQSSSLSSQRALSPLNLDFAAFEQIVPEFVFIAKVIIRYIGGNWQWIEATELNGSRSYFSGSAIGSFISAVQTDASLDGTGIVGDPLLVTRDPTDPLMDGVATPGVAAFSARSDHVHPSDTSKADTTHNHDLEYSPLGHNHDLEYDPIGTGASEAASAVSGHESSYDHDSFATLDDAVAMAIALG